MPSLLREVAAEPLLVVEATALRGLLAVALDRVAMDRLLAGLTPRQPRFRGVLEGAALASVERATELVLRRVRVTRTTCLLRSLIRYRLLRERGVEVVFKMGVRHRGEELEGHAWIELRGQPVLERESTDYQVTFAYPNPAA